MLEIITKAANSGRIFGSWMKLRLGENALNERDLYAGTDVKPNNLNGCSPHLLLFAWSFPPDVNAGVYRPASFAKYAVRAGWRVTVVCSPVQSLESAAGMELVKSLPVGVEVFRALPAPPTSYRLLPKVDGGFPGIVTAWQMSWRQVLPL
jgi:hypothetical protein